MFRMIRPETLPDLITAESGVADETPPVQADAAAARTRADYGRVSRWGLGLLGTFGAAIGCGLLGVAVELVATAREPVSAGITAVVVAIVAALALVPSVWLLVALQRSGRRLARAAGYWAGLPYRQGRRAATRGDWFSVRFLAFSGDLFLRVLTSALAGLAAVFTVSSVYYSIAVAPSAGGVAASVALSALLVSVCVGQFGGVQRIQNGYTARDPWTFARRARG